MKKRNKIIIVAASIITFAGSVFAFSEYHDHDDDYYGNKIVKKITRKLDLTDAQVSKLNVAKDAVMQAKQQMHENKPQIQRDILAMLNDNTVDRALIINHLNDKSAVFQAQMPLVVNAVADFYESLDAEQQSKINGKLEDKLIDDDWNDD